MKGNFFLGNGKFEVREMAFSAPGPHEVFVRNKVCGICGTDVHIYHGEKGSADVTPPVVTNTPVRWLPLAAKSPPSRWVTA